MHDLRVKSNALLSKWLYKLLTEEGDWQNFLRNKYLGPIIVSQAYWKHRGSHFWEDLMATKNTFFHFGSFTIEGLDTRFWEDKWMGNSFLREQYLALYLIVRDKNNMHKFWARPHIVYLSGEILLAPDLRHGRTIWATLIPSKWWKAETNSIVMWQSGGLHGTLCTGNSHALRCQGKMIKQYRSWRYRSKLKKIMWYLCRCMVLTMDNLAHHNWHGSKKCSFFILMR